MKTMHLMRRRRRSPGLACADEAFDPDVFESLEPLEARLLLSTITWINRGQTSDRFAEVFGGNAAAARAVIDAAIADWENVVERFNYASGEHAYDLTLSMAATGTDRGGLADASHWDGNKPDDGWVRLGRGNDTNGDGLGDGGGYYIDPVPTDWAEFDAPMAGAAYGNETQNVFYGVATDDGLPPIGLSDFYTLAAHEIGHALGLRSGTLMNARVTNTAISDTSGGGFYYVFNGANIDHLMTSTNGGVDAGAVTHIAHGQRQGQAGADIMYGGTNYVGVRDLMNHFTPWTGRRALIGDTLALILQDAYGYTVNLPQTYGTFHAMLNRSTNELWVRGGNNDSDDVITINYFGGKVEVSVDLGDDEPGTGALPGPGDLPAFVSKFDIGAVSSIRVEAGDGDDTITVAGLPSGVAADIDGEEGVDVINLGVLNGNLADVNANVTVAGGDGYDTLNINDSAGDFPPPATYNATASTVAKSGGPSTSYATVEQINLYGRGGGNVINIDGVGTGATLDVFAGAGTDHVHVNPSLKIFSLAGDLHVDGQGGDDTLTVYDDDTLVHVTYQVGAASIADNYNNSVSFTDLDRVWLNGGSGSDTYEVSGVAGSTDVTLNCGDGDDTILVNQFSGIFSLGGPLEVHGEGGMDLMTVYDTQTQINLTYDVTFDQVNDNFNNEVNYYTLEGMTLNAGQGSDVINVDSLAIGTPVTVNAGPGNDDIRVTQDTGVFVTLAPLTVSGDDGHDTLNVFDSGYSGDADYEITENRVGDHLGNEVFYGDVEQVLFNASQGNNIIRLFGSVAPVTVFGHDGSDHFAVHNRPGGAVVYNGGGQDGDFIEFFGGPTMRGRFEPNDFSSTAGLFRWDGQLISFLNVNNGNHDVVVNGFEFLTMVTPGSLDVVDIDSLVIESENIVSGTSDGLRMSELVYRSIGEMVLDTGTNDSTFPNDIVTINPRGARIGCEMFRFVGGTSPANNDRLFVNGGNLEFDRNAADDTRNLILNINTDNIDTAEVVFHRSQTLDALQLGTGGRATIVGSRQVIDTRHLFIAGGAVPSAAIDLGDGAMIVNYDDGGASPRPIIAGRIANARNANPNLWTGEGIGSRVAAEDFVALSVGDAEATDVLPGGGVFFGVPLEAGDRAVLVRLTRNGDSDLDGDTDISDFNTLASNFDPGGVNPTSWRQGDFDRDGDTDISDFNLLATAFNPVPLPMSMGTQGGAVGVLGVGAAVLGDDAHEPDRTVRVLGQSGAPLQVK